MPRSLLFFALFIFVGIVSINLWTYFYDGNSAVRQQQSDQLGNTLLAQNKQLLLHYLQSDQIEAVKHQIDSLAQLDIVQSSALYRTDGTVLYQSALDMPALTLIQQTPSPIIYLEPLMDDESLIGFVKLVLDREAVTKHHIGFLHTIRNVLMIIFILTLLITAILVGFIKRHRK